MGVHGAAAFSGTRFTMAGYVSDNNIWRGGGIELTGRAPLAALSAKRAEPLEHPRAFLIGNIEGCAGTIIDTDCRDSLFHMTRRAPLTSQGCKLQVAARRQQAGAAI
jgi:hypothetical protein